VAHQVPLSPAENAAISVQIARLHYPEERRLARGWSATKQVAEFICRPRALPALRRQVEGADRVFLAIDRQDRNQLRGNSELIGTGTVRSPVGWRDFTFICGIDSLTGRATHLRASLLPVRK